MILLLSYDVRRRGGIERLSLQVQACLQQRNVAVRLLCPQRIGPWALGRQLGRLWFLVQLAWWLPRAEQVLSMHALLLRPIHWLRPLRRRGQALRCWLHGIEVWGAALDTVRRDLLGCQGLIASSHFTRERLLEQPGPWPPVAVVHPMADLIGASAATAPLPPELRLLTVARLDAAECYKGHRLVMAALQQLLKRDVLPSGLVWRVVGDGNDRSALEGTSEQMGLAPWVQFLGVLPDEALREELRHCSLLLMPSAYAIQPDGRACGEGFGIVYLEAAQAGRASIACLEGGQADLIEHGFNGWLINPNADELASLLMDLAANPQRLVCAGAAARQRARADFTPETFHAKLLQNLCLQAEAPKPCSQT